MSAHPSRNAPCPCGSGRKYKHCCLALDERSRRTARFDTAVGVRIEEWTSEGFRDELRAALRRFTSIRSMDDAGLALFALWFHNDRELSGGGTPAERYAARPELDPAERATAARIAGARLGFFRVVEVRPGRSLTLEPLTGGPAVEVESRNISREAVRWDLLLAHLMPGDPRTLWGPSRVFEAFREPEVRDELERLGGPLDSLDQEAMESLCRRHALELLTFQPPNLEDEHAFFTLEGDPVVFATARWQVLDVGALDHELRGLAGLSPHEPVELHLTAKRDALAARCPVLPPGAIVLEASDPEDLDTVEIAVLRLSGDELRAEAMSEERLDEAIEAVEDDLGELVGLLTVDVKTVDEALVEYLELPDESWPPIAPEIERRVVASFLRDRMLRWVDEPHQALDGRTPREAAEGASRGEVVRLLRQLENNAEHARRHGDPTFDVGVLRNELGLGDELAA